MLHLRDPDRRSLSSDPSMPRFFCRCKKAELWFDDVSELCCVKMKVYQSWQSWVFYFTNVQVRLQPRLVFLVCQNFWSQCFLASIIERIFLPRFSSSFFRKTQFVIFDFCLFEVFGNQTCIRPLLPSSRAVCVWPLCTPKTYPHLKSLQQLTSPQLS